MVNKRKKEKDTPRTRLVNDERRRKLLELGISLFSEHTYEDLSIGSIAELAGISKGLLYHYFPTKREFYLETLRAAAENMLRMTEAPRSSSPDEAVRFGLDAYLDYVIANAAAYVSLLRGGIGVDPEVAEMVDEVRGRIVDRLIRRSNQTPATAVQELGLRGWIGFVEHATIAWLERRSTSRESLRDLLIAQLGMVVPGKAAPLARRRKAK